MRLGTAIEIDIGAIENDAVGNESLGAGDPNDGGVAMAAATLPSTLVEAPMPEQYEYEVLVFDEYYEGRLVAAVEFVSPRKKDRPASRNAFVAKCAALLENRVAVSIVDLVTARKINLYADLLAFVEQSDARLGASPP